MIHSTVQRNKQNKHGEEAKRRRNNQIKSTHSIYRTLYERFNTLKILAFPLPQCDKYERTIHIHTTTCTRPIHRDQRFHFNSAQSLWLMIRLTVAGNHTAVSAHHCVRMYTYTRRVYASLSQYRFLYSLVYECNLVCLHLISMIYSTFFDCILHIHYDSPRNDSVCYSCLWMLLVCASIATTSRL